MEIEGACAVVTGAASGIGRALAAELVARGGRVVVADLDADGAAATAAALGGDVAVAIGGDAASTDGVDALVDGARDAFGAVPDLYCANAGVARGCALGEEDDWAATLEVNLLAHVRAARKLVPHWTARPEGGHLLVTASAAGLLNQVGDAPYGVTKHAAVGFAEWIGLTYGDRGVRVTCLCPMGVETPLLRHGLDEGHPASRSVELAGAILAPEAVAQAALDGVAADRFLVLPHPEVLGMYQRKGHDYDGWIAGMRRFAASTAAA